MKKMMKQAVLGVLCVLCAVFIFGVPAVKAEEKSLTISPTVVKDIQNDPTKLLVELPATGDLNYKYLIKFKLKTACDVRITGLSRYAFWNWNGDTYYTLTNSLDEFSATYSQTWETNVNADHSWSDKAGNYCDKFFSLKKGTYYLKVETKLSENALTDEYDNHKVTDFPNGFWLSVNSTDYVKDTTVKSAKNVAGKKAKISYKKSAEAEGYQIQYATKKNFSGKKTVTTNKTSVTLKSLKKGKTYYVRVRAYRTLDGKTVYGNWSNVKSVKIKK